MIYTENMLSLFPNRFRIYHSGMWIMLFLLEGLGKQYEKISNILKGTKTYEKDLFALSCDI